MTKAKASIIYTTDGQLTPSIRDYCFEHLTANAPKELPIIKVENSEGEPRSHRALFENILAGIETAETDFVFLAEHDVLYPEGYFDLKKLPELSYSKDIIYLSADGFYKRNLPNGPLSTLAGDKETIKKAIEEKIKLGKKLKFTEPGVQDEFSDLVTFRKVKGGVIDIRHGANFTGARRATKYLKTNSHWGKAAELWSAIVGDSKKEKETPPEQKENSTLICENCEKPLGEDFSKTLDDCYLCDKCAADLKEQGEDLSSNVSVIITSRNESLLAWTIDNINRTAPGCEIIVVYDGWQSPEYIYDGPVKSYFPWAIPLGVGPCRDYGIEKATRDYVVLLDAHMDFEDQWLEKLLAPVMENPAVLSCSKSAVLNPDMLDMQKVKKTNAACRMQFINEKGFPFEPKWIKPNPAPGEVQIILGACYGMKRSRYMVDLFRPWQNAFGWGTSEQLISTVNWFLRGDNVLTDALSAHVYRRRTDKCPYKQNAGFRTGMFYNRCRFIDLLPIDDKKKKGLIDCVLNRRDSFPYHNEIKNLFVTRNDDAIKEAIAEYGRTWDDYQKTWFPEGVKFPAAQRVEKKKIIKTSTQTPAPKRTQKDQIGNLDPFSVNPSGDSRFI